MLQHSAVMAASLNSVYKRRTKDSAVLWRGSRSGARIWMLIINCFVCLRWASALNCSGVEMPVATYPGRDISINHGSPLEIYCSTEDDVRDLHFTVSGKQLQHTVIVNDTTIRLYIPNPVPQRNTYYCSNTATRKHCINNVLVDDPPHAVTDFSCLSNNLASLNCSWTSPNSYSDIKYNVSFYVNNAKLVDCIAQRIRNTRYCLWSLNTEPQYRQNLATYVFHLLAWNVFGSTSQNITVDHFAIVKPEKPANLKVLNKNPHNVTLQWQISRDLVDYLDGGVEHKIEYQIDKVDNQNVFHQVDTTLLAHKNYTYIFVLTELPIAHMQYEVRIYIRSVRAKSEDFWSDFSFIFFQTPSEIPHRPPNMPAGSFFITPYRDKFRSIYVYWEQLEEFEECGDNFTYEILVTNVKEPLYPDKKKTLSFVMLSNITKGGMEVSVKSKNSNGTSMNSSLLYIPPQADMLEGPSSFTKLAYANGTYELSWVNKGLITVDNYTLVWCKYVYAKLCDGRIKYTVLRDPKKTSHVVNLPGDERYNFAISVNQGPYTSGLVWARCDISKDAANYDIPVHLENSIPIGSSVMITWTMDCTLRDGIVTGFNLTYCPINETSNLCDDNVKKDPIHISDPKSNKTNVTDLLYHRIYKFDFVLLTANGPIPIKDTSKNVLIPEGTPSHPLNIKISDITHDSLVISYDPPEKRNGNIVVYVIYNNNSVFYNDTAGLPNAIDTSRRYTRLTNLIGFTDYVLNVQACNKHCSELKPLDAISVRTSIGPPGRLRPPTIKYNGDGVQRLEWAAPRMTAGLVDMYQVKRVKDGEEDQVFNTTDNFLNILSHFCDGVSTYYLRAVNFDSDLYHGARAATENDDRVILPQRKRNDSNEYLGDWSDPPTTVDCRSTLAKTIMYLAIFTLFIATVLGFIKLYRIRRRMKDIEPWLPDGLGNQEFKKYPFNELQPSRKDNKPEEKSLLYDNKTIVPFPEVKQKDKHSGTSDHTASTIISDTSGEPVDMEASTSDEGSDCALDTKLIKNGGKRHDNAPFGTQQPEKSAPFGDVSFKINPNGYVQSVANPLKENVSDNVIPFKIPPPKELSQPTTSSYVVASLEPPTFTSVVPSIAPPRPAQSSGYVSHSDIQPKSFMNFPMLGSSPTNPLVPEAMPITPPISKYDADSFPLQTLDALWGLSRGGPAKACSPGYVSPEEAVLNKHLSLLADSRMGGEDPAILEPNIMSPDAYCRFSWNVNPANDNLNSLHAEPPVTDSSKN